MAASSTANQGELFVSLNFRAITLSNVRADHGEATGSKQLVANTVIHSGRHGRALGDSRKLLGVRLPVPRRDQAASILLPIKANSFSIPNTMRKYFCLGFAWTLLCGPAFGQGSVV